MKNLMKLMFLTLFMVAFIGSCEKFKEEPRKPIECSPAWCEIFPDEYCCDSGEPPDDDYCEDFDYHYYDGGVGNPAETPRNSMYHMTGMYRLGDMDPDGHVPYLVRPAESAGYLSWAVNAKDYDGSFSVVTDQYPKGTQNQLVIEGSLAENGHNTNNNQNFPLLIDGQSILGSAEAFVNVSSSFAEINRQPINIKLDDYYTFSYLRFDEFRIDRVKLALGTSTTTFRDEDCHTGSYTDMHMIGRRFIGKAPHVWGMGFTTPAPDYGFGTNPMQYGLSEAAVIAANWLYEPPSPRARWDGGALWRRNMDYDDYIAYARNTDTEDPYVSSDNHYWIDVDEVIGSETYVLSISAFPNNFGGFAYKNIRNVTFEMTNIRVNGILNNNGTVAAYEDPTTGGARTQVAGATGAAIEKLLNIEVIGGNWDNDNTDHWGYAPMWGVPYIFTDPQFTTFTVTFDVTLSFSGAAGESQDYGATTKSYTIDIINTNNQCEFMPYSSTSPCGVVGN